MTYTTPVTASASGFVSLANLLRPVSSEELDAARQRVAKLDRQTLLYRFSEAFMLHKRLAAFVMAEELTERGIPPCFRHDHLSRTNYIINQTFDLMVYDLRWLKRTYPEHRSVIRYKRCKRMFTGYDRDFHAEAEFAFYDGTRATWKIVKSLRLTEEQQLDCFWLHSAPIAKRVQTLKASRDRIFGILMEDMRSARLTKSFTKEDAKAALFRRHRLWLSRGYTNNKPAAIAKRYAQLTGMDITPQIASRQLAIVDETLRKARSKGDKK